MEACKLLKTYTDILISESSTWNEKRESLHDMHRLFVELGSLSVLENGNEDPIWLEGGCAVSPKVAAFCLFEISRTRLFVLGLRDAIQKRLSETKGRVIQILDAGCGPYALLSLLTAQYFSAGEVQFNLLDIHPENIESSRQLIELLGMMAKFGDLAIDNACTFQWPHNKPLDIIVSETMLNALRKEPQVAITLNLAKQLTEGGILIPEKIEVDLEQSGSAPINTNSTGTRLTNLITLSKNSRGSDFESQLASLVLPSDHDPSATYLNFTTTITVFDDYVLKENDSSLTLPRHFSQPNKNALPAGARLNFRYEMGTNPAIQCEVKNA